MTVIRSGRWHAAAGAVAVGAALAVGELAAGIFDGIPSPLLAVARVLVDIQPPGAKEVVVALFGTADKLAFEILIVVVAPGVGAMHGPLAAGRPDPATAVDLPSGAPASPCSPPGDGVARPQSPPRGSRAAPPPGGGGGGGGGWGGGGGGGRAGPDLPRPAG